VRSISIVDHRGIVLSDPVGALAHLVMWRPIIPLLAGPGRMRAGWAYFVSFQQAAKDFAELSLTRLPMPVLVIGGEKANGDVLGKQMKIVALDATAVVLKDTGHWVMEERPKETTGTLMKFL
jgi:pimeloyl-ACP methyl ester carboxylesterase